MATAKLAACSKSQKFTRRSNAYLYFIFAAIAVLLLAQNTSYTANIHRSIENKIMAFNTSELLATENSNHTMITLVHIGKSGGLVRGGEATDVKSMLKGIPD
jgi:hypothetical protein